MLSNISFVGPNRESFCYFSGPVRVAHMRIPNVGDTIKFDDYTGAAKVINVTHYFDLRSEKESVEITLNVLPVSNWYND